MKSSNSKNSKLQAKISKSLIEESVHSSYRAKQLQDLERLKNICFPKRDKENISENSTLNSSYFSLKKDRSISQLPVRGRDSSFERRDKNNSLIVTRTSSAGPRENSSLIINRERSFNMSPLAKATQSDEEIDIDTSFDKGKNRIFTPFKIINTSNICNTFGKVQEKLVLNPEDMIDMKDCKSPRYRENFLTVVENLPGEMNRFCYTLAPIALYR